MIAFGDMAGFGPSGVGAAGASGGYSTDSTVCPLCLAHHDAIVTLECGHDFCRRCVSQHMDGNMIKCPRCYRLMDLNDQGLEGLQSNYLINNILNIVSLADELHTDLPITSPNPPVPLWSHGSAVDNPACQMCRGTDVVVSNVSILKLCVPVFSIFNVAS